MSDKTDRVFEIESLNLADLEMEGLERRLELAASVPLDLGWLCTDCSCNGYDPCGLGCGCCTYCPEHCGNLCTDCVDCVVDCGLDNPPV